MRITSTRTRATFLLLAFVILGCGSEAQNRETEPPVAVSVADIITEMRSIPIRGTGTLQNKSEQKLSFVSGGVIASISVDEGEYVRSGQVLAVINTTEIDAAVSKARVALDKAERDRMRIEELFRDSVATLEQLENVRSVEGLAKADVERASFNRRFSEIRAPGNGRIVYRLAEPGELTGPGVPVLVMTASNEGQVIRLGLADRDVVKIRLGDRAHISFDAFPGNSFMARVTDISRDADPVSGVFKVELALDTAPVGLRTGFIAGVDIYPEEPTEFSVIPIDALVEGDERTGIVFATRGDSTVQRVEITIAEILNEQLLVQSGLEAYRKVVTAGAAYLRDGQSIHITN